MYYRKAWDKYQVLVALMGFMTVCNSKNVTGAFWVFDHALCKFLSIYPYIFAVVQEDLELLNIH